MGVIVPDFSKRPGGVYAQRRIRPSGARWPMMPDAQVSVPEPTASADPGGAPRAGRRVRVIVVVLGLVAGLLTGVGWLASTTSGYVTIAPGPVFDVSRAIRGPDLNPDLAKDRFYLTTVNETMASWWRYFIVKAFGGVTLLPVAPLSTSGSAVAVTVSENALMLQSQESAVELATSTVHKDATLRPAGAEVVLVSSHSVAAHLGIRVGDTIVSVQGRPVATPTAVESVLGQVGTGASLLLGVVHGGRVHEVRVARYQGPGSLGVELAPFFAGRSPYRIEIPGVGGPSGGLVMALAMTDALSQGSLAGHQVVAGTGELTGSKVLPIEGVAQKVIGAEDHGATVFFAPLVDAPAARLAAHGRLKVVGVTTYTQALGWLCAHGATSSACR